MALAHLAVAALALASAAAAPPAYKIETVAGSDVFGDGGPAVNAQLSFAQGIAIDGRRNIYIADTGNHRIRKVTPDGRIATIAGTGRRGMEGDGGPALNARFDQPYGLALDAAGNLYVADLGNHRVRKISPDGIITTVAGAGGKGSRGDGGPAAEAQLMSPRNVALDAAGNLYISEFEGHRVRRVSPEGVITTFAGTGVAGLGGDGGPAALAQLAFPAGLAVDRDGALFIADSGNHRIRKVTSGGIITTYLGTGVVELHTPAGVALDANGTLYVTENTAQVRRFPPGREPQVTAGTGVIGYDGDGRSAETSLLTAPAGIAFDADGNFYLLDGLRVRRVEIATKRISTVAGDAYLSSVGDGGPAIDACLHRPAGIFMDPDGSLYIADSGTHRVRRVDPAGRMTTLAGSGVTGFVDGVAPGLARLNTPMAVAAAGAGSVFVADTLNHRVRRIFPGSLVRTVAGSGGTGMGADGRPALETPLHGPRGLATDGRGHLYIADTQGHRVVVLLPSGALRTIAGNGSAGFGGDGGRGELAQLSQPSGITYDGAGNLYIADAANHRIRKVDGAGIITTVAGNGKAGYAGDGGPALAASLNLPRAVAVDGNGNLYIADTGNHAIRHVAPDGTIRTLAGNGEPGFAGDGGFAFEAQLEGPEALLIDGSGRLWVSDTGNHRVRLMTPVSAPAEVELAEAVVVNAASMLPGPVAPGMMVAVFAEGIGPEVPQPGFLDGHGRLSTRLGGAEVLFDGIAAPLFHAQSGQLNAQVPYEIAGRGTSRVEVRMEGELRARGAVAVAASAPALFTAGGGDGAAAVLNEDGSLNSEANPAARGSLVTLFATGEGLCDPAAGTGRPAAPPYGRPLLPVRLTMGGIEAEVVYAGRAPGFAGLMQINARVPAGFVPTGWLALELTVGGAASQPGVNIAVR